MRSRPAQQAARALAGQLIALPVDACDRRFSNLAIFVVSAAVAVTAAVLAYQPVLDTGSIARDARTADPVRLSPRCQEADRASIAQLGDLLQRNRPGDAAILERAIHTLNTARRHCLYDWEGRGFEDYEWLRRWLSEHS
jgi:hypothetical protein